MADNDDQHLDFFEFSSKVHDAIESGTITYLAGIASAQDYLKNHEIDDEDQFYQEFLGRLMELFIARLKRDLQQLDQLIEETEATIEDIEEKIEQNETTIEAYKDVTEHIEHSGHDLKTATYADLLEKRHGERFIELNDRNRDRSTILTDSHNHLVYIDEQNNLYSIQNGQRILYDQHQSAALLRQAIVGNKVFANYTTAAQDATNRATIQYYAHNKGDDASGLSSKLTEDIEAYIESSGLTEEDINADVNKLQDISNKCKTQVTEIENTQRGLNTDLEREEQKLQILSDIRDSKSGLLRSTTAPSAGFSSINIRNFSNAALQNQQLDQAWKTGVQAWENGLLVVENQMRGLYRHTAAELQETEKGADTPDKSTASPKADPVPEDLDPGTPKKP